MEWGKRLRPAPADRELEEGADSALFDSSLRRGFRNEIEAEGVLIRIGDKVEITHYDLGAFPVKTPIIVKDIHTTYGRSGLLSYTIWDDRGRTYRKEKIKKIKKFG